MIFWSSNERWILEKRPQRELDFLASAWSIWVGFFEQFTLQDPSPSSGAHFVSAPFGSIQLHPVSPWPDLPPSSSSVQPVPVQPSSDQLRLTRLGRTPRVQCSYSWQFLDQDGWILVSGQSRGQLQRWWCQSSPKADLSAHLEQARGT